MKDGICATCAKGHICTFPTAFKTVTQCDEYEGEVNGHAAKSPVSYVAYMASGGHEEGLCATCGIRTTCTYTGDHAGVVQCEDFC